MRDMSYLKDWFTVLKDLNNIGQLPNSAKLITADTVSMYTNIDTNHGLHILSKLIQSYALTDPISPTKHHHQIIDHGNEK